MSNTVLIVWNVNLLCLRHQIGVISRVRTIYDEQVKLYVLKCLALLDNCKIYDRFSTIFNKASKRLQADIIQVIYYIVFILKLVYIM